MKISNLARLLKDDFTRLGQVPGWIDALITPLNQLIDTVGNALGNNLTFVDNFYCLQQTQSFTHGTELQINPKSKTKVLGVLLPDTGGQMITGYRFTRKSNGNIGVTINFLAGSGTTASCTVIILLG